MTHGEQAKECWMKELTVCRLLVSPCMSEAVILFTEHKLFHMFDSVFGPDGWA